MRGRLGRGRREPRLDPVRWCRPDRGVLLRLAAVATLLATAAVVMWSRPQTCASGECVAGSAPAARSGSPSAAPSRTTPDGSDRQGLSAELDRDDPAIRDRSAVPAGTVGVPIRLAEPTALKLLRSGDRVDLFQVGASPEPVATAALVLEVTGVDDPTSGGLLLALTPAEAQRTVTTAGNGYAVLLRPDG